MGLARSDKSQWLARGISQLIICHIPVSEYQWNVIQQLKRNISDRLTSIYELVLPFTLIPMAQSSLNYYMKTLEEITLTI
jgi:hypothetical protein